MAARTSYPLDGLHEISSVMDAYFAFAGPQREAAQRFLQRPLLDVLCVLGEYTIAKPDPGGSTKADPEAPLTVWAEGDDALGAFLQMIDNYLR